MTSKQARAIIKHYGFTVNRGGFVGTCDDCIDGWYLDPKDATTLDRRGRGFTTLEQAAAAAEFSDKMRKAWEGGEL